MTPLYTRKHATRTIVGHSQRKHVCYSVIKLLQSGLVIHFSLLFLSLSTGMDFAPTSAPFPPPLDFGLLSDIKSGYNKLAKCS